MRLTVVVPTYNRSELLGRALRGLLDQTLPAEEYEIVVVDDGSTDATPQVVAAVGAPESRLRYLRQENQGPAAARNYGTREAKGNIILFTGDDCLPDRKLLEVHLQTHARKGDVGVIGLVAWHPELEVTPFMSFLEEGVQFGFKHIRDPEHAPFWCFYTSNCSVQKHRLEEVGGFDTGFPAAAFEDIELAYRMQQRGLRLVYRSAAVTYHHHATTLERYLARQRLAGQAAVVFWRKHPELSKKLGIEAAAQPYTVARFYHAMLEYTYSLGVREALRTGKAPLEDESAPLWRDAELIESGRAWIYEVFGGEDPVRHELNALREEYERITSRRLYRLSEAIARLGWGVLHALGLGRRPKL